MYHALAWVWAFVVGMRDYLWALLLCGLSGDRVKIRGESYRVLRHIADGGFSQVLAVRRGGGSGETFAVKKIILQSEEQIRQAQWEIKVHQMIGNNNPNCLALLASEITSSSRGRREALLLFPILENGSLVDHLLALAKAGRELGEQDALAYLAQICNGLKAFHSQDPPIAHRDIKPHNILLAADGTPVLMDFGSAAIAYVDTSSRQARLSLQDYASQHCSMAYRAPELWEPTDDPSCIVDERTDIWSLGCLLFAMLFGQGFSPFECKFSQGRSASGPFVREQSSSGKPSGAPPQAVPRECTYLSIIGAIPLPASHDRTPAVVQMCKWMLTVNPSQRPTLAQVMQRLPSVQQSHHHLNIV
mmetsp:Transcript_16253/g.31478  ORF Transcript_16253/g.31478 Transcript_16253/m.31478 type:complete len:360 (-) Transcript_16253:125-1204(-)